MISEELRQHFRALAAGLEGIDSGAYADYGKDPLEPVIGLGRPQARVGFFGRDPGRDEVRYGMPFIGAGGQKVRAALYEHMYGRPLPDFAASVAVGDHFFWANTVPYKPVGNKAWSEKVKRRFQPLMAQVLLESWHGREVITLGREAFLWFAINQPRALKAELEAFWGREERFNEAIEVTLSGADRPLRLHPLPHPSPLNATWYRRFPDLLKARLVQLDVRVGNLE